ncbi:MAG: 50S ribosomal protein L9 [Buchnera aphidicola (Eriosoma harunire)]
MKVILLEQMDNLGHIGTLLNVKSGYARNFLIPTGKAIIGNKENIKFLSMQKSKLKAEKIHQLSMAKERANRILNFGLIDIKVKSGEEGKLFGSIGSKDIAASILALGESIDRKEIKLPNGLIKNIGIHEILFQPNSEYVVPIKINIIS